MTATCDWNRLRRQSRHHCHREGDKLLASQRSFARLLAALLPSLDIFAKAIRALLAEATLERHSNAKEWRSDSAVLPTRASAAWSPPTRSMKMRRRSTSSAGAITSSDLRFAIENDARMALLGERHAGAAAGCDNVVMITLGTGIGGAAMIEGKLLRGKHAQAGCLGGHLPAKVGGRQCTCGAIGCLEAEASGWALPLWRPEWKGFARQSRSSRRNDQLPRRSSNLQIQAIGWRARFATTV